MITLVTILHVVVCIVLILVILLQAGKGGGMGAGLGGGGSQTVFGGRGSQTFLGKVTSVSAGLFMLTSLTLAYHASRSISVVERVPVSAPAPVGPAQPSLQPPVQPAPAQPTK